MNQYESVFIMHPVLSEEQVRETVEKFKGFIEAKGGKVLHLENWGLKKLAYPIQSKRSGFYHLMEFQAEGEIITRGPCKSRPTISCIHCRTSR